MSNVTAYTILMAQLAIALYPRILYFLACLRNILIYKMGLKILFRSDLI